MVLIEIVSCLVPIRSVAHFETFGHVVPVGICGERAVSVGYDTLVERIVLSQSFLVEVFVGGDTCLLSPCAVEEAEVVASHDYTVPCLTGFLEVSDVLIANLEVVSNPCQSAVV